MFNIVLACLSGALLAVCVVVAMIKERARHEEPLAECPQFDVARLLRNRSERSEDW
jgi:hypothetical protein